MADPAAGNASGLSDQMLDVRQENLALVGHILDDERSGLAVQASGYRVQDMRSGASTTRTVAAIDPSSSRTTLRLDVGRSQVFASTRIYTLYTFPQVVSLIGGLTVGILGAFKAAFAMFEKVLGDKV